MQKNVYFTHVFAGKVFFFFLTPGSFVAPAPEACVSRDGNDSPVAPCLQLV